MHHRSKPAAQIFGLLATLLFASLACDVNITIDQGGAGMQRIPSSTVMPSDRINRVGFDFTGRTSSEPQGDLHATSHLFIHMYPMPSAGLITGVTYLNDAESGSPEVAEMITLLVLSPVSGGFRVIHRVALPRDDRPPVEEGVTTVTLESPLPVQRGDFFAHWQEEQTGPIPFSGDWGSIDGLSVGKYGFTSADVEVGQVISDRGFSGRRDYFLNVILEPAP